MHPTADFVPAKGFGFGALYLSDKTTKAPIPGGLSGHRYYSLSANYGLSSGTNLFVYHNRVVGRYHDEHLQMTGLILKQRLTSNLAIGLIAQVGNQDGKGAYIAFRLPLIKRGEGKQEDENGDKRKQTKMTLNLHFGLLWTNWRGEWTGKELVPYGGVSWSLGDGWLVTAEVEKRRENFFEAAWAISVQRRIGRDGQVIVGVNQSGISDRAHIFLGFGVGIGGILR